MTQTGPHIAVIVLPENKGHIPGEKVARMCHRSFHSERGFVLYYLLCTHFLGVCVWEEGHSGFVPRLALLIVGMPEGFSC